MSNNKSEKHYNSSVGNGRFNGLNKYSNQRESQNAPVSSVSTNNLTRVGAATGVDHGMPYKIAIKNHYNSNFNFSSTQEFTTNNFRPIYDKSSNSNFKLSLQKTDLIHSKPFAFFFSFFRTINNNVDAFYSFFFGF
jgi:hypothetical protein